MLSTFKSFTVCMVKCNACLEMLFQRSFGYQMSGVEWTGVERWTRVLGLALHQMIWHSAVRHHMLFIVWARNPIRFAGTVHDLIEYRSICLSRMKLVCAVEIDHSYKFSDVMTTNENIISAHLFSPGDYPLKMCFSVNKWLQFGNAPMKQLTLCDCANQYDLRSVKVVCFHVNLT